MRMVDRRIIAGRWKEDVQFEEGVGDLEHEDVGVPLVVHDEDALGPPSHSKVLIVILEAR
jgi:hypothetical protein